MPSASEAVTRRWAQEGPTEAERVLDALPGTVAEVAERVGATTVQVASELTQLRDLGQVDREGTRGSYVWRRAGGEA